MGHGGHAAHAIGGSAALMAAYKCVNEIYSHWPRLKIINNKINISIALDGGKRIQNQCKNQNKSTIIINKFKCRF